MEREEQWKTYQWWSGIFRPLVVCGSCGSTNIDHKPAGRLTCFNCKNAAHWSPDRFRIVRDIRPLEEPEKAALLESTKQDFANAVVHSRGMREREMRDDSDWYGDIIRAVESFLDGISTSGLSEGEERATMLREELETMADRIKATVDAMG